VQVAYHVLQAVLADAERLAADAPERLQFLLVDLAIGQDHAKQQQKLGRKHRIVGDAAHGGIALHKNTQLG
jgi:hypothetical protein